MIYEFGNRLREQRKKYHFTQRDVAERLNVSSSVVAGYEQGNRCPSVEILCRLADIYHCSTDYLLGRTNAAGKLTIDVKGLSDNEIEAISHLIDAMKHMDDSMS